jgi:hypothetical protein
LLVVIQTMMGAGMAVMYGFFYPHVSTTTGTYIATGAPTLALIPLGLMIPASVEQQKLEGKWSKASVVPTFCSVCRFPCRSCWRCPRGTP